MCMSLWLSVFICGSLVLSVLVRGLLLACGRSCVVLVAKVSMRAFVLLFGSRCPLVSACVRRGRSLYGVGGARPCLTVTGGV